MKNLWFITRSWFPTQSGGVIVRSDQVKLFSKYFQVHVITPQYSKTLYSNNEIPTFYIPVFKDGSILRRGMMTLERVGLVEDYLDDWVYRAYLKIAKQINKDDLIFVTTGGEIASLKLGVRLKKATGSKLILNYHDPIDYTKVNGYIIENDKKHVLRDKIEFKYLKDVDVVFTSSYTQLNSIRLKYASLNFHSECAYFGFPEPMNLIEKENNDDQICIFYAGVITKAQAIENICEAVKDKPIKLVVAGDYSGYPQLHSYIGKKNITFLGRIDRSIVHQKIIDADIGYLSLSDPGYGACIPSKLYEYLNAGIPMLGGLPEGDARDLINKNEWGIAVENSVPELKDALSFLNRQNIKKWKNNVMSDRLNWSMEKTYSHVIKILTDL